MKAFKKTIPETKERERERELVEVANLRQKEIIRLKNILGFLESALQSRDETIKEYVNQVAELKNEAARSSHIIAKLHNENELLKKRLDSFQKSASPKLDVKRLSHSMKSKSVIGKLQFTSNGLPIKTDPSPKHIPLANVETLKQFRLSHIPTGSISFHFP